MYNQWHDQLYGNFRTRTFSDIFPSVDIFINEYQNNGIEAKLTVDTAKTLYYLLYGQYGNSHIASSDENTFKYRMWSIIYMYGAAWQARIEIQDKIRNLSEDEIRSGDHAIYNHAYNPSTSPGTDTTDELKYIDDQRTTRYKKGIVDAYTELWALLDTDVTKYFLDRFRVLFLSIVEPEYPLWYITQLQENNNDDGDDN